jgi:hypothetical protein
MASGTQNPRSHARRRGSASGVVETDAAFLTPKKSPKGYPKPKKEKADIVLGRIERSGRVRLVPVSDEKRAMIEAVMRQHISPDALVQTDKSSILK